VLENLFFTIAEAGSGVLVPAPYYAAFDFDLSARAGVTVVAVVPEGLPGLPGADLLDPAVYYPTAAALDAAHAEAEANGTPPAALLVSSPNNPLGVVYPPPVIAAMIRWCEAKGIHYVSEEIYGGARHGP
jgi:aspartate/methionine/tyrosine aminotransferase